MCAGDSVWGKGQPFECRHVAAEYFSLKFLGIIYIIIWELTFFILYKKIGVYIVQLHSMYLMIYNLSNARRNCVQQQQQQQQQTGWQLLLV